MHSVLFVCTGNLYRSPLAAAFFRAQLIANGQSEWVVESAGTWTQPGQSLPPETVRAAAKFGANVEDHFSHLISAELLSCFDLVIVMEKGHKEALDQEFPFASSRTYMISQVVDHLVYDIPDPLNSGQEIDILASDLHKLMERGYKTICELVRAAQTSKPSIR
jgi:protein-tyrosine phosphatase